MISTMYEILMALNPFRVLTCPMFRISGNPSFITLRTRTSALLGFLPLPSLQRYVERYPLILLTLAKRLIAKLSPLVVHIDFALEWGQVNAGQVLCRESEPSDSIYIVLNGRLRSIRERDKGFDILNEHGQGESVGELEVLMDVPRSATVHAIRDTEVAVMPKSLFNALATRHPEITMRISRIIASRVKKEEQTQPNSGAQNMNLKTVAIIPVTGVVPVCEFADRLKDSMDQMGISVCSLNTEKVMSVLGKHAFSRLGKLKLMNWLAEKEEIHRLVLYVADGGVNSPWTQRCIRQADCILMVALGDEDPTLGEFERLLLGMKTYARKELVLLHPERYVIPGSTAAWLKNRLWIQSHHHVCLFITIFCHLYCSILPKY